MGMNEKNIIFIDNEDIEERYGKDLYITYLEQQLQLYKDKEEKLREIFKDYNIEKPANNLSQCTYEITAEEMYKILHTEND